ncbi:hypothetical protein ANN_01037 [Periplaneta americana]|uniref:Uncharacterized protein n=1 Tax=Periplaneta americana TaxID=6978 RepID=A0ABQ8TTK7_PERAM|nr:hypothetical protein ANN_01037 [Periplaneta americana]
MAGLCEGGNESPGSLKANKSYCSNNEDMSNNHVYGHFSTVVNVTKVTSQLHCGEYACLAVSSSDWACTILNNKVTLIVVENVKAADSRRLKVISPQLIKCFCCCESPMVRYVKESAECIMSTFHNAFHTVVLNRGTLNTVRALFARRKCPRMRDLRTNMSERNICIAVLCESVFRIVIPMLNLDCNATECIAARVGYFTTLYQRLNEMKVIMAVKLSGSSTESYPAFAQIGLRENSGINLNQANIGEYRMSTYMSNLESGHKEKNTGGEGFDPLLWIVLRRSSMVKALEYRNKRFDTRSEIRRFPFSPGSCYCLGEHNNNIKTIVDKPSVCFTFAF